MHGLVPLNSEHKPVRHAILWNDTRNSEQCAQIKEVLVKDEWQYS